MIADIPGLIEGAAEGAGLGIQFLKHLERCGVLLHLVDVLPADGSDPAENAKVIIAELEKYSEKLANKPRWLVFNKIDLMDKAEAEAKAKAIAEAMGWEEKYYLISAASQVGVKDLCWDVMTFIIENPIVQVEEAKQPEKVEFMWDDYHRQQLEELEAEEGEVVICCDILSECALNAELIDAQVEQLMTLAEKFDVEYDGWGTYYEDPNGEEDGDDDEDFVRTGRQ